MADAFKTLVRVKRAAGQAARIAREWAFQAGTTDTSVEDGKILQASKDGTVVEVTNAKARTIPVSKRRWVLGEETSWAQELCRAGWVDRHLLSRAT